MWFARASWSNDSSPRSLGEPRIQFANRNPFGARGVGIRLRKERGQAGKAVQLLAIEVDLLEGKTPASAATANIGKAASRGELQLGLRW